MPGLVGVVKSNTAHVEKIELLNARNSMKFYNWYKDDKVYEDNNLVASRTHLNVIGLDESPYEKHECACWVEGEIYNIDEVADYSKTDVKKFPDLIIETYFNGSLVNLLSKIDGYYAVVLYDKKNKKILCISDRFGLKPLYIWQDNYHFAWASEIKAFLSFSSFSPIITEDAFKCFIEVGYLLGNRTWFKNVEMIGASSILTYNIDSKSSSIERYWNWSNIKPANIKFEDAAEHMGTLIKNAVRKRCLKSERIGVSLSGGLDSRSVYASISDFENIFTYTFGKTGCEDVEIAKKVANVKHATHKTFKIDNNNWFQGRIEGIWKTDGMFNLLHMHDAVIVDSIREHIDINIDGFIGDLNCGGGYITLLDSRINQSLAEKKFGKWAIWDKYDDSFYDIHHADPYYINTRVRRFTNPGTFLASTVSEYRKPFIDNKLNEYIYSLPDKYRKSSALYNNSLLITFPEYFGKIPWQRTGLPISKSGTKYHNYYRLLLKLLEKSGLKTDRKGYTKYREWINEEPIRSSYSKIVSSEKAIYKNYCDEDLIKGYLLPHQKNINNFSGKICNIVTAELWFQMIFNGSVQVIEQFHSNKY